MNKIESRKEHRKERKELIKTDFRMKKNRKRGERKTERRIAVVCTINKICAGENTTRTTSKGPQEPQEKVLFVPKIISSQLKIQEI